MSEQKMHGEKPRAWKLVPALIIACFLPIASAAAAPLEIRIGWIVPVTDFISIAFEKQGLAVHEGHSYKLQLTHFQGSSQEISALATGDLNIGVLGFSTFPLAVQNAGMADLRIIADEMQDGVHDYYSNEYMVRADSPIRQVEDLRGKVVATNAIGSGMDIAMEAMLAKEGLRGPRAVTVIEAPLPTMRALLLEQKTALIPAIPPFAYDPRLRSQARVLFTQEEALGPNELAFFVARSGFLQEHRGAIVDFLADYLRAVRWYLDPAHHDEAVAIAATFSKMPETAFQNWLFTTKDEYRDSNGLLNVPALQSNVDTEQRLGFIKRSLNVRDYVDLSLDEEAAKGLH